MSGTGKNFEIHGGEQNSKLEVYLAIHTVVALNKYTLSREERRFLYFNQRVSGTNDTSFESPNIGRSEFAKKLAVASF